MRTPVVQQLWQTVKWKVMFKRKVLPFWERMALNLVMKSLWTRQFSTFCPTTSAKTFWPVCGDLRLQFTANRVLAGGTGKYHDRLYGPVPPVWNMWLEMALNTPWRPSSIASLLLTFLMVTSSSQNFSFSFPYLIKTSLRNIKWRHTLFYLSIPLISF